MWLCSFQYLKEQTHCLFSINAILPSKNICTAKLNHEPSSNAHENVPRHKPKFYSQGPESISCLLGTFWLFYVKLSHKYKITLVLLNRLLFIFVSISLSVSFVGGFSYLKVELLLSWHLHLGPKPQNVSQSWPVRRGFSYPFTQ